MKKPRKKFRFTIIHVLVVLFLVLVAGYSYMISSTYKFNHTTHVLDFSDANKSKKGVIEFDDVKITIGLRRGNNVSWENAEDFDDDWKIVPGSSVGAIFEAKITNLTEHDIENWKLTLEIPEKMAINDGWNGEIEIHQNVETADEVVEKVLFKDKNDATLKLKHVSATGGTVIPLEPGDFFVYYPSEEAKETVIPKTNLKKDKSSSQVIGFIMYFPHTKNKHHEPAFTVGTLEYEMTISIADSKLFVWLLIGTVIWFSMIGSLIVSHFRLKTLVSRQKRDELIIDQSMQTFINFIDSKDPNTRGHSLRVAKFSELLVEKMGYNVIDCKKTYYIALMHDCGKMNIPDEVLLKPGKLTPEEFQIIKDHTKYGSQMLKDFNSIEDIDVGARYHHEKYDGTGYPEGLKGEEIPLIARIICIADSFDAMNSKRCYRDRLPKDYILKELKDNAGKQFDPELVEVFLELIEEGKIQIGEVREDTK